MATTKKRRKKRKRFHIFRTFLLLIVSVVLIGMLCAVCCGMAFAYYVREYILPNADVAIDNIGLNMTSIIYVQNPDTGEYYEYETLYSSENRTWADFGDIPQNLKDAFVAIEDKDFYLHKGVYWKRTFGAALAWITGDDDGYGGSTITQQLIKNIKDEKEVSVKRKLNEIFRALELEKKVGDKDRILELYMNTVYFGKSAYGVCAAAETYFGKELDELTLAECALIAGITNNPSQYNPLLHPQSAQNRQRDILWAMHEQGYITDTEYREALAEELEYSSGDKTERNHTYSWFTETVIHEVLDDLCERLDYSKTLAETLLYTGGLRIYTTMDPKIQNTLEQMYLDDANFPDISKNGRKPQSAMVVMDADGNIKGIVGARGDKEANLLRNHATMSHRQPGSSIKPLSVYAPALDQGLITPDSVRTDMPVKVVNGNPYPRNYNRIYSGQRTMHYAVMQSLNTIPATLLDELTFQTSFDYLTERFGMDLVERMVSDSGEVKSDLDYGPLGMGGLTRGVTVREMCAAYTAFMDGNFAGSRSYTRVEDDSGAVVIDNTPDPQPVFDRESTVYYIRTLLEGVVSSGGNASFVDVPNMSVAAKTGTTQNDQDRYFVGFTPYYVGACWFGYEIPSSLDGLTVSPPAQMWERVMQAIHEDLPPKSFEEYNGYTTTAYCKDSGLRATEACRADIGGNRTATGRYFPGDEPVTYCNLHQTIKVCAETEKRATEFCPETKEVSMLDLTRLFPVSVSVSDQYRCFTGENPPVGTGMVVSGGSGETYSEECDIHDENFDPEGTGGEPGAVTGPNTGWPWPDIWGNGENPNGPDTQPSDPNTGNTGVTGDPWANEPNYPAPIDPFDPEYME
ncbi:MAG: hypothetical protein HFH27_01140 [Clostridiaceae bacterium]|nr:hypothetical protein [Clostridiaceae bacterium]